jgi:hypothetical protein
MTTDQERLWMPLLLMTGVFIASLFLMLAVFRYGDSFPVIVMPASLPLFVLSLAFLVGTVWRGVLVHGITKIEAWWWLSAPYSFAFPLALLVFRLQEFGHPLALFYFLSAMTTLSLALWMLAKVYKLMISETRNCGLKDIAMLAVVALTGILWTALIVNPGR